MSTKLKFSYDSNGRVIEEVKTGLFGLICLTRVTYRYDDQGNVAEETHWYDKKRIKSVKCFRHLEGKKILAGELSYDLEGNPTSKIPLQSDRPIESAEPLPFAIAP